MLNLKNHKYHYSFDRIYNVSGRVELHYTSEKLVYSHTHDFCEFLIVISGIVKHTKNDKDSLIKENHGTLITCEDSHSLESMSNNFCAINVSFKKELMEECCGFFLGDKYTLDFFHDDMIIRYSHNEIDEIQLLFSKFDLLSDSEKSIVEQTIIANLLGKYILSKTETNLKKPGWLLDAIQFFKNPNHYMKESKMDDVYKLSGYSKAQFIKNFKLHTNMTPIQYYVECKMQHASSLLSTTNLGILEISSLLGYDSLSHFNHTFKQRFKCTPNEYRNKTE